MDVSGAEVFAAGAGAAAVESGPLEESLHPAMANAKAAVANTAVAALERFVVRLMIPPLHTHMLTATSSKFSAKPSETDRAVKRSLPDTIRS